MAHSIMYTTYTDRWIDNITFFSVVLRLPLLFVRRLLPLLLSPCGRRAFRAARVQGGGRKQTSERINTLSPTAKACCS